MIAVDTNILVYAHRADSEWHQPADRCLTGLAESGNPWAIPWPCLHEFLAIATHPRIYDPPTPLNDAIEQVNCWLEVPTLVLLSESAGYWESLEPLLSKGRILGPKVHDARIAALCQQHGVTELWTADRDFNRFSSIHAINPLVNAKPES
ncbi:type II toxin-antitoxin system VapC family toxin [Lyngbya confervoides]|uniref:Ribonuclease VapC n=1 Tax=Lyngbya confervoides BDU141951 TaxID=1574623 RepID=A0ABD4T1E1_9CYAN|nr:TA system VapC family ribonuclease toxin [Lyngbya confervoides]MCM1982402.1 PIN domain-containing protein [Lyngbya confervoides BDU141951]